MAGYFDLGFALARGNARTDTLSTVVNASRTTRNDKTTVFFNQIYSTATLEGVSGTTANAVGAGISYDHNLTPRLFVNVFNTYLHDEFQDLNLRFVIGGGLGFHAIKTERLTLDLIGGADYDRENFTDMTRNSAEIYWGNALSYKISGVTSLTQNFRMYNNMTDLGEYRLGFDIGTETTIRKWLSWQLTASDRYLSNPAPGRKTNDVLLTTGLRINFGHALIGGTK